jgi:hypothetical protein
VAQASPATVLKAVAEWVGEQWQVSLTPQQEGTADVTVTVEDELSLASQPAAFQVKVNARLVSREEQARQLNAKLKLYQIWFNQAKNDQGIVDPETGKPARMRGRIGVSLETYTAGVMQLRQEFERLGLLDAKLDRLLGNLTKSIRHWDDAGL